MILSVNGVEFGYSSTKILENITFEARPGRILGILGENGCGKTTLLNCINRMLEPQGGCIMVESPDPDMLDKDHEYKEAMDVNDLSRKEMARCCAVVSQNANISFPYTAYDAVKMGRYARPSKDKKAEAQSIFDALKMAGALEFAERPVNELSGGELRRVMIARALAQEPSVLLLDEPTLHLDMRHQFNLMDLISSLRDDMDMIVVMVTHDLTYAARYCDDVILMDKGRIIHSGASEEILTTENVRDIFHIDAIIEYDERVGGLNVVMIGEVDPDGTDAGGGECPEASERDAPCPASSDRLGLRAPHFS